MLVVTGLLFVGVTAISPAAGADQVAILSTEDSDEDGDRNGAHHVEPGEEFTIDLTLYAEGGHGDDGVVALAVIAQYHPDYLEVTDIERGPWLEQGDTTDITTEQTLAHDEGIATLEQWREPAAGGATGMDTVATVTVAVAPDAPDGETTLEFGETNIELESDWPVPVVGGSTPIVIGDGGAELESFEHDESAAESGLGDGPSDDESQSGGETDTDTDTDTDTTTDEEETGFVSGLASNGLALVPAVAVGVGLILLCALLAVRLRDQPSSPRPVEHSAWEGNAF
ncbi:hypothetical protein C482_00505 [Natrialba chahannaoensis JCM 10990]|uniref:Cellulosome anchoring protein cohesin region n=1 Tax=Natrialba chahannaoensis JCM 10990 TaxID=1227492 RepID=M0B6V7_9EURY|nr:hypothetical protein C482_00505 [Natrialba chahannaoensis JCM 10990]